MFGKTTKAWNKGKTYSSLKTRGENNHNWKGGIYLTNRTLRRSPQYKRWQKSVYQRDNFTCVMCGAKNGNGKAIRLEADHIKSFSLYPELRFDIDNGRTLCTDCHYFETYGKERMVV